MKIIAATNNPGKVREIKSILEADGMEIVSLREAGINIDPEENGTTFEENALIKARAVVLETNACAISDDSGLCVDYLSGAPGIYSARYAGEQASDAERIIKLLSALEGVKQGDRTAHFISAAAYVSPDGTEIVATGRVDGYITTAPDGAGGFGYDPVFYSSELKKTYGAMTDDEKNSISHRYRALKALKEKMVEMGIFQKDTLTDEKQ